MTFKVPERYRITSIAARFNGFDAGRVTSEKYGNNGCFFIPRSKLNRALSIIVSDGYGWEHVSIHAETEKGGQAIPNWGEMCLVKDLFWDAEDACIQYHPRASEYVTAHPFVLHIWRPSPASGLAIPEPPAWMVGNKPGQTEEEARKDANVAFAALDELEKLKLKNK